MNKSRRKALLFVIFTLILMISSIKFTSFATESGYIYINMTDRARNYNVRINIKTDTTDTEDKNKVTNSTTGNKTASTTGKETASTTGKETASTTGKETASTTGNKTASTTGKETTSTTGNNETTNITERDISVSEPDMTLQGLSGNSVVLEVWKFDENITNDNKESKYNKLKEYDCNTLVSKSRELGVRFVKNIYLDKNNLNGNTVKEVSLDRGSYYLIDKSYKGSYYFVPVIFSIPASNGMTIDLKHISNGGNSSTPTNPNPSNPTPTNPNPTNPNPTNPNPTNPTPTTPGITVPTSNGVNFIKVGKNDKGVEVPLYGAVFKVTKKEGTLDKTVKRDGVDYIVKSGEDGKFRVDNLEPGDYSLWEITPPKGYQSLVGAVKFVVSDKDDSDKSIEIENDKKASLTYNKEGNGRESSGRVNLPKTGDIGVFLLAIEGIVITLIGYIFVRRNNNRQYGV